MYINYFTFGCAINSFLLFLHCEYLQSKLSIQFDDLFKKAWEEDDFSELERDGVFNHSCSISIIVTYI